MPNKATLEVREWARAIFANPKVLAKTEQLAERGKLAPAIYTELLRYAYGKPKDTLEITGPDGATLQMIQRVVVDASHPAD